MYVDHYVSGEYNIADDVQVVCSPGGIFMISAHQLCTVGPHVQQGINCNSNLD